MKIKNEEEKADFFTQEDKEKLTKELQKLLKTFEFASPSNTILKLKTDHYLKIKIYENGHTNRYTNTNIEAVKRFNSTLFKYHTIGDWFLVKYENFGGLRLYEYEIPLNLIDLSRIGYYEEEEETHKHKPGRKVTV